MDPEDIFEILHEREEVTFQEFKALVEDKVQSMGGLCDYETAAKLVASDFGINSEIKFKDIAEISVEDEFVSFVGKVVGIEGVHEFSRDDGSVGRVANLRLADSTGDIKLAVWDELADLVKIGEIEKGEVLRIEGAKVKEGFKGMEISVSENTGLERGDSDIDIEENFLDIEKVQAGMDEVNVRGKVLEKKEIHKFEKKDGSQGKVASILLGKGKSKIDVSLWGEQAEKIKKFSKGDCLEIRYGYSREKNGKIVLNVGKQGDLQKTDEKIFFQEEFDDLNKISEKGRYDVKGRITGIEDIYKFQRKDGSEGKVVNLYLSNGKEEIKCAFWGENAEKIQETEAGDKLIIRNADAKKGLNESIELNAGWQSSFEIKKSKKKLFSGNMKDLEGGMYAEITGQVVSKNGILDDGTGYVFTSDPSLPFGKTIKVEGFCEIRNKKPVLNLEKTFSVEIKEEEVEKLLQKLEKI